MKGEVIYVDQIDHIIHLYVRAEDGNKYRLTITNFRPYFYVPNKNGSYLALDGNRVKKIIVDSPSDVRKLRELYKMHYEADIRYTQRFLIDSGIKSGIEFEPNDPSSIKPIDFVADKNICYLDIEANINQEITCVTIYSSLLKKYFTFVWRKDLEERTYLKNDDWVIYETNSEKKLLFRLITALERIDPDILAGYYLTEYDYPMIEKRLAHYNLRFNRTFDLFDLYKAYHIITNGRKESYHLKNVVIEEGIAEPSEVAEYEEEWWSKDIERLLIYNKRDVEWIVKLDSKRSLIPQFNLRKRIVGLAYYHDPYSDITIYNQSSPIDIACLRKAREVGIVLPSKSKTEKVRYKGAFVYLKKPGLYRNIANYDFSQYYPSIILSFKLDPYILANYYKKHRVFSIERYVRFAEDWVDSGKPNILLDVVREFQVIRRQVDEELAKTEPGSEKHKELQNKKLAVKALINAIYGVLGFPGFRLSSVELAGSVTQLGREGITYLKDEVQRLYGYETIYCDTDSLYLQIPFEKAEEMTQILTELTNKYFNKKYGVKTEIKMKLEKYCEAIFFETKKHYSAKVIWEGKPCNYIDIKGSEAVRRDESRFTRRLLKEFYELVLNGKTKGLPKWYSEKVKEFMNSPLEEIVIPATLRKSVHEYEKKDVAIRGILYANKYLGCNITSGRVYILYVKGIAGLPPTDVIAVDDISKIPKNVIIDWKKMIHRCIISKLEKRFNILGYGFRSKQTTLV